MRTVKQRAERPAAYLGRCRLAGGSGRPEFHHLGRCAAWPDDDRALAGAPSRVLAECFIVQNCFPQRSRNPAATSKLKTESTSAGAAAYLAAGEWQGSVVLVVLGGVGRIRQQGAGRVRSALLLGRKRSAWQVHESHKAAWATSVISSYLNLATLEYSTPRQSTQMPFEQRALKRAAAAGRMRV